MNRFCRKISFILLLAFCFNLLFIPVAQVQAVSQVRADSDMVERVYYPHTNHLGSVVAVTDEQGTVVSKTRNYPYGGDRLQDCNGLDCEITERQYTGQIKDKETDLYYYNARYYDPDLGTFISADSVNDQINRYAYVGNNPVMNTDPSGHNAGYGGGGGGGGRGSSRRPRTNPITLTYDATLNISATGTIDGVNDLGTSALNNLADFGADALITGLHSSAGLAGLSCALGNPLGCVAGWGYLGAAVTMDQPALVTLYVGGYGVGQYGGLMIQQAKIAAKIAVYDWQTFKTRVNTVPSMPTEGVEGPSYQTKFVNTLTENIQETTSIDISGQVNVEGNNITVDYWSNDNKKSVFLEANMLPEGQISNPVVKNVGVSPTGQGLGSGVWEAWEKTVLDFGFKETGATGVAWSASGFWTKQGLSPNSQPANPSDYWSKLLK